MDRRSNTLQEIIHQGMLPLYYHPEAEVSIQILKTLYHSGIRVVEYTNRGENAIDNFLQLRKAADESLPGLRLGVGTIRNAIEATEFINEGADFIVSPGITSPVAALAEKNGLLWIPGCLTATEIMLADDLGVKLVKLFPGSLLGPSYLAAVKEVFPHLLFMPTGGVDTSEENITQWFQSGAIAVGLGSKLISKRLMETSDYSGIESLTRRILQVIQKIRNQ